MIETPDDAMEEDVALDVHEVAGNVHFNDVTGASEVSGNGADVMGEAFDTERSAAADATTTRLVA